MKQSSKRHISIRELCASIIISTVITLLVVLPLAFLHVHDAQALEIAKTSCDEQLSTLRKLTHDYNALLDGEAEDAAAISAAEVSDESVVDSLGAAMSVSPPQSVDCNVTNHGELEQRMQELSDQITWFDDHVAALRKSIAVVNDSYDAKQSSEALNKAAAKAELEAATAPLEASDTSRPKLADYADVSVQVDISAQRVYVQSGGSTIYTMVTSTGAHDLTPRGDFAVERRGLHFYPESEKMGGDYWVGFHGSILFHSVPTGPDFGDYLPEEAAKLGQPVSHGCVRLTVADATWFYEQLEDGTPVHVY